MFRYYSITFKNIMDLILQGFKAVQYQSTNKAMKRNKNVKKRNYEKGII